MADNTDGLFAIEVGTDDYAEAAAEDTPEVSRTYQSEANFQAQKATYTAETRHTGSSTYDDLIRAVPVLALDLGDDQNGHNHEYLVKLSKKDGQLLNYAVGELYYDRSYIQAIELCERVKQRCVVDAKLESTLRKWMLQCKTQLQRADRLEQDAAPAVTNSQL